MSIIVDVRRLKVKESAVFNNDTLLSGEVWISKCRLPQPLVSKLFVMKKLHFHTPLPSPCNMQKVYCCTRTTDTKHGLYQNKALKVKQPHYRPDVARGFQEVKVPRFRDNGTEWW